MKIIKTFFLLIISLAFSVSLYSQDYHVRIAFMGNSITIGAGLSNPTTEAYPGQVSTMLGEIYGDTCVVGNFAVSGRTMLKNGDYPLWNEAQYVNSWKFAPDIVFILLGTNDTKPQNWEPYSDEYDDDYQSMIDSFRVRNPRCIFMSGFPPPCFETEDLSKVWYINDSIILNGVIPIVDSLAKANDASIVDFYHALRDSGYLFPDEVHPNVQGSKVMAQLVVEKIQENNLIHKVETGYTFVTSVKSNNKTIPVGGTATISWTTINADSVMVEGQKMDPNGSMIVNPTETKVFTVYAYGPKSIDSMKFTQSVYIPELEKIGISPRTSTVDQGDSIDISLSFYDQESKAITDKTFDVNWSVLSGGGSLINETNKSVTFIATEAGKITIRALVGEIFVDARVTVNAKVNSQTITDSENFKLFPNPATKQLFIQMEATAKYPVEVSIYDVKSALCQNEHFQISTDGNYTFSIKTDLLNHGWYLLKVTNGVLNYSEKFRKR